MAKIIVSFALVLAEKLRKTVQDLYRNQFKTLEKQERDPDILAGLKSVHVQVMDLLPGPWESERPTDQALYWLRGEHFHGRTVLAFVEWTQAPSDMLVVQVMPGRIDVKPLGDPSFDDCEWSRAGVAPE